MRNANKKKQKKNINIPEEYFKNQEFLVDNIADDLILGILGKDPSPEQMVKFELCNHIVNIIDARSLTLSEVQEITHINSSDISRIKNYHLDRFTIDRLIRICFCLGQKQDVSQALINASDRIKKLIA